MGGDRIMAKYKVTYSDDLPTGTGGKCFYPLIPKWGTCKIIIRPKYKDNLGLLKHEIKHAEQYHISFFHELKYELSKKYRYKCELEAYKEQMKTYNYTSIKECEWIVKTLLNKYDLGVSKSDIEKDLKRIIDEWNNNSSNI
jgi:hypothetical protein